MMKYIFSFIFLALSLPLNAQLDIKSGPALKTLAEYKTAGKVEAALSSKVLSTGDTMYLFGYSNFLLNRITDWKNFSVLGINDARQILQLVKTMYDNNKKDEEYTFKVLNQKELNMSWMSGDVIIIVTDQYGSYSTFRITKKILDKLNVL